MSIDYDLFIIKSDNEDTTHSQLRDCIADAIENLQLRIELLENGDKEKTKSKEPLIKDEKIRKAVRAWAEANGIKEIIIFDHCNNAPYTPVGAVEFAGNASRLKTVFRTEERFDTNRIYAIAELCGEEEE